MADYINDQMSGDLRTVLKAIGKVKTIFELWPLHMPVRNLLKSYCFIVVDKSLIRK